MRIAKMLVGETFTVERLEMLLAEIRHYKVTPEVSNLAHRLSLKLGSQKRKRVHEVAKELAASPTFHKLFKNVGLLEVKEPEMFPAAGAPQLWGVPPIATLGELCEWLKLDPATLSWLCSSWRSDGEATGKLQHYRHRWIPKKGGLPRLIEAPLPRLKTVQQKILHGILERIPAHPAAHGFVKGRGIVSFTEPHLGQRCVLRMDIRNFFPTIRRALVLRVFLTAGYPEPIAGCLADLCTTSTPNAVRQSGLGAATPELAWPMQQLLKARHLPQGAPTSPALANCCAFNFDKRLTGLAATFNATYTRYADDLLFSGGEEFRRDAARCEVRAAAILLESGFATAHRKTRIMNSSTSQRAAGIVLNEHAALPRQERDQLKAILTNCLRHVPSSQNRSGHPDFHAHLLGRISHARHVNPTSAEKLVALFEAIDWS